ncbi:PilT domain-containing protein [Leptolyngbya boryana NIES-2135]|jgi:predicted nucleic acid-binding protein|uniref:PilT domain-containing protein n=1 Tax=Leptolyngbya boryana NIES-2135 TaxID=1973484 RepID=A0A1Z4JM28_LEPBY|nr:MULTISPECIES: type II toxin-antitoxin system VapC family toxin [Leptolyngbya]BAY57677.1 PilT domain-containing protein [Leptolyngbya boryana NIES-2135]MBD2367631.1 type II toxin-antitoxin system VapC family toxin [Leptolyngbya sp. FACHB-161]MBD2374155.1 type II toxin-antitoxin system VapC family toxin [Leptolyngbya sp. FACHB-238]MBD2398780.1 type II toxin-antitoxin system VapC family toxin [Leptolyngbya sp. FACHB-239]MBD2405004.1 type II toxin-antitoxin system VapC family toxin [Leptolyngby
MSAYVVDASVVIQYAITQEYTPEVRVLIARMYQVDRLYLPEFCLLECTNVIWKAVRFNNLAPSIASQIITELQRLPLQIEPVISLLPNALQIGLTYQLAIYDSLYIALAEQLDLPLISLDERQVRAAAAKGLIIQPLADFSSI